MRAILTFHSIDNNGSVLSYPVGAFAQLMTSITKSGIPVLELDQLLSSPSGVVITFDDGFQSLRDSALPVLRGLGLPSHLFLTTGVVGGDNHWPTQPANVPRMPMLTWDDIDHCLQAGMRVESHTHMHPDLRSLSSSQIEEECESADREIVAHTGRAPRHFAYPYGYFDDRVALSVRKRYTFAVTTKMAFLEEDTHDAAKLPRLDTYYLKGQFARDNPFGPFSRAYLTTRRMLRAIREGLQ